MKTRFFSYICFGLAAMSLALTFSSCCKDDDDEILTPGHGEGTENVEDGKGTEFIVKDNEAGIFVVENMSSREILGQTTTDVIRDDTLLVLFQPKQDYRGRLFPISCKDLEKINDSIFVVPGLNSGSHTIEFSVSDTIGHSIYRAQRTFSVNVPKSYVSIPITVNLSADLLQFVDVELAYTDKGGLEHNYSIKEDEWIRPDSVVYYIYKKEDGHIASSGTVLDGCEVISEEKVAPNPHFEWDARFFDINEDITTSFIARYSPKSNLVLDRESYFFTHAVDRESARVSIPGRIVIDIYNAITIDLTDKSVIKDNVEDYLEELAQNPDVKKFRITTEGRISQVR